VGGVHLEIAHRVPLGVAAALAFAAVGLVAALLAARRPAFGIAALLILDPFAWAHDLGPTQITFPKAALVGVAIALLARRVPLTALRDARVRPLAGGALAIVAVTALSAIPGTYIDAVARETLKALEYVLAFGAAAVSIASDDDEELVRTSVLVASALVCASALVQYVTGAPSGAFIGTRAIPRIAGLLEGPNQLAGYLDLATPVLLASALAGGKLRSALAAAVAIAIATDVLTLSRAGLFGLVAGILVVLLSRPARGAVSLRFALAGAALVAALATLSARLGFLSRFSTVAEIEQQNGLGTRGQLWHAAATLWSTDPALGVGAGNFELLLPNAGLIGVRTHANSLYLQSLAEGGIALFCAVLWTIVSAIALCLREAPRSALLLGVGAATVGFALHQIFDVLTFYPKVGGFWWLLLGAATGRIHALGKRAA
jgi:O-antigen ligase